MTDFCRINALCFYILFASGMSFFDKSQALRVGGGCCLVAVMRVSLCWSGWTWSPLLNLCSCLRLLSGRVCGHNLRCWSIWAFSPLIHLFTHFKFCTALLLPIPPHTGLSPHPSFPSLLRRRRFSLGTNTPWHKVIAGLRTLSLILISLSAHHPKQI